MRNRYLCCSFLAAGSDKTHELDAVTFPNPDKDADAVAKCLARAETLRTQLGKHAVHAHILTELQADDAKRAELFKRLKVVRERRDMNSYQDSGWSKAVAEETDHTELEILRQLIGGA